MSITILRFGECAWRHAIALPPAKCVPVLSMINSCNLPSMLTESSHTVESWVKHQHLIWMYSTRSQQALNSKIASNILAVELRGHRLWDIKKCQTLTQVSPASEFSQSIANLTAASLIKQMISHCHIRSHHQTALEATSVLVQNTYNIKSRPRRNATRQTNVSSEHCTSCQIARTMNTTQMNRGLLATINQPLSPH